MLTVNGEPIDEAEIRATAAAVRKNLESRGIELNLERRLELPARAAALLIERTLMFQECRRLGIAATAREVEDLANTMVPRADGVAGCRAGVDLTEVMREAERKLNFDRAIEYWCRSIKPPKSTEVRNYYRSHQQEFHRPETIHASHLLRNKEGRNIEDIRRELEKARQRLLAGEDFAGLAATSSDCPENGGDLGFFARRVMVEEFDEIVFTTPLHEFTPVFETRFGVHVAVVHERRPAGMRELTEVGGKIAEALYSGKRDEEVGRKLRGLQRRMVLKGCAT